MKHCIVTVLAVVVATHLPQPTAAQGQAALGCGGGVQTSGPLQVTSTLGQPLIGTNNGRAHRDSMPPEIVFETGFWYQPFWLQIGIDDPMALGPALPTVFSLGQNYPNPFNPTTTIEFALPQRSHITIKLYSVTGRELRTIIDGTLDAGYHHAVLNAHDLASGIYYCRMVAEAFVEIRKLVLLK